uniref:Coiled-coil domain containing 33 n=1 Tax=Cyprinus carpio TaxID=7962 RepID=A0A8C1PHH8_CYPCA
MQNSEKPPNEPASAQMERGSYDLPSHDALSKILPEYLHLLKKPKSQTRKESVPQKKSKSELNRTFDVLSPLENPPMPDFKDDPHEGEVTEHQTKELENYRVAMHKMADDILALRSQVSVLESEKSQLRRDLSLHQDLLDDTDTDVMTKSEIADRIASLKFKVSSESSKAAAQKDRIQQLQNELIRKNDIEKEFVQLQRAHQQQQAVLKKYQARSGKISALEDTVHQQEKVIEKMEKILDAKLKERNKENSEKKKIGVKHKDAEELKRREIESVLAAENSRLREELHRLRNLPPAVIIQQPVQLKENSRQWGKEKQEMLTRLSEYEHGFARTSSMILLDLPVKSVTDSVLGHTRHRQLEPLK